MVYKSLPIALCYSVGTRRQLREHIMQIEQDVPVELTDAEIAEVAGGVIQGSTGNAGVKG